MKILIVTQYFAPERFRINDISQGLLERGHEVTVLTGLPNYPNGYFFKGYSIFGPYREIINGVKVIRVPLIPRGGSKGFQLAMNYISFMVSSTILAPIICKQKYDKIFVYQLSPVTSALPAVMLHWLRKIPVIFWVTDLWPETLQATGVVKSERGLKLWGLFVKFLYDQSQHILVSSKGFINKIEERGVPLMKISYWPYWGEDIFINYDYRNNVNVDNELPVGFKIMFAGNIGTSQSFETIVVAAELLKKYSEIKWIILGDGLKKPWLENAIREKGLENTIYLLGNKPLSQMPEYYSKADVLLAALKKDPLFSITLPSKIQSYLPSGKPILISMDGEGAELIESSKAGVACAADDPIELANGALKLYKMSAECRADMGDRGKEYYFQHFERSGLLDKLEKILEG